MASPSSNPRKVVTVFVNSREKIGSSLRKITTFLGMHRDKKSPGPHSKKNNGEVLQEDSMHSLPNLAPDHRNIPNIFLALRAMSIFVPRALSKFPFEIRNF